MSCELSYIRRASDVNETQISTAGYPGSRDTFRNEEDASKSLVTADAGPTIRNVYTTEGDFANNQIPKYETLEITFQIYTLAENLQLAYDSTPPNGVEPEIGISVDAFFAPDD
jgi:hypothetical protein